MKTKDTFRNFYNEIHLDGIFSYESAIKTITKKLNEKYYNPNVKDIDTSNCVIVGSIGRGTAINNTSDVDMLFILPWSVYYRFDAYKFNGQSALLQEIKAELVKRYPRTDIKGDGQAVVVGFDRFSIDLVPAFKLSDGSFVFPDSNNGGRWNNTNPIPEQVKSSLINKDSNNNFIRLANMLRCWKDNSGFIFSGLLIDTLVYDFLNRYHEYFYYDFDKYDELIKSLLKFLSEKDGKDNVYALGSGQLVHDKGKGKYIEEAKGFYDELCKCSSPTEFENVFLCMFGNRFKKNMMESASNIVIDSFIKEYKCNRTEQFIEDLFPINIKYSLRINCNVKANGWRVKKLRDLKRIPFQRHLEFYIEDTNVPKPYSIYWKVRNLGEEAYRLNQIRGEIRKGENKKRERSEFNGPHYVECYLVKNGVCVARDKIPVNIYGGTVDGLEAF